MRQCEKDAKIAYALSLYVDGIFTEVKDRSLGNVRKTTFVPAPSLPLRAFRARIDSVAAAELLVSTQLSNLAAQEVWFRGGLGLGYAFHTSKRWRPS